MTPPAVVYVARPLAVYGTSYDGYLLHLVHKHLGSPLMLFVRDPDAAARYRQALLELLDAMVIGSHRSGLIGSGILAGIRQAQDHDLPVWAINPVAAEVTQDWWLEPVESPRRWEAARLVYDPPDRDVTWTTFADEDAPVVTWPGDPRPRHPAQSPEG